MARTAWEKKKSASCICALIGKSDVSRWQPKTPDDSANAQPKDSVSWILVPLSRAESLCVCATTPR